jgi:hypothetical protein
VSASQVPATLPAADVEQIVTRFFETEDQYHRTFRNLNGGGNETHLGRVPVVRGATEETVAIPK